MNRQSPWTTHGTCRRHFLQILREAGISEEVLRQELQTMSPGAFCEDLAESVAA